MISYYHEFNNYKISFPKYHISTDFIISDIQFVKTLMTFIYYSYRSTRVKWHKCRRFQCVQEQCHRCTMSFKNSLKITKMKNTILTTPKLKIMMFWLVKKKEGNIHKYLHFPVFLTVITLPINVVTYSPIHFINEAKSMI